MLAVTGVNSCVYCSYRHTKTALERRVNNDEIRDILNGEFGNVPENEQIALCILSIMGLKWRKSEKKI